LGNERLASRKSAIDLVPMVHRGFAQSPAQINWPPIQLGRKVDESSVERRLVLGAELLDLANAGFDFSGQVLRIALQLCETRIGFSSNRTLTSVAVGKSDSALRNVTIPSS